MVVSDSKRFIKKVERSLNLLDDARAGEEDDTPLEPEEDCHLRIWTIHAENSGSEENSKFIQEINFAVQDVDALLVSPSLGTGVDISTPHFDMIFGAFHAVSQSATECAQQLWRVRNNLPMHVWVAKRPPFGYRETNPKKIKEGYFQRNELTAFLIRIDPQSSRRGAEKDWMLDASCQIEAQRNASVNNLRQDLRSLLEEMGNRIIPQGAEVDESSKNLMKAAGKILDQEHCQAVAQAKDIDGKTYEMRRRQQDYLKPEERMECEKFRIRDAYGKEVMPELVAKDNGGWRLQKIILLEGVLAPQGEPIVTEQGQEIATPPQIVVEKDKYERDTLPICTDWKNYSALWQLFETLGMRGIVEKMMAGEEVNSNSEEVRTFAERAKRFRHHIKQIMNLTIPINASPMWILAQFLGKLGLSTKSRRAGGGEGGSRPRNYRLDEETLKFTLEVLRYRQERREQKERQQRLDQELASRRAAGMDAQYGSQAPPLPESSPPPVIRKESYQEGYGQEPTQEEGLSEKSSDWITNYTQRVRAALKCGVAAVKSLLGSLMNEDMWAVAFTWEAENLQEFNQFTELAPDWFRWCRP